MLRIASVVLAAIGLILPAVIYCGRLLQDIDAIHEQLRETNRRLVAVEATATDNAIAIRSFVDIQQDVRGDVRTRLDTLSELLASNLTASGADQPAPTPRLYRHRSR